MERKTKRRHTLGDLQLAIMRVLWRAGEASVAEAHQALVAERGLAPTTIATMLVKMEKKGVVTHRREGRRFVYRPTVTEAEVRRSMVDELTQRLFLGDPTALVSHLIAEHEIDAADLAAIRGRLAASAEAAAARREAATRRETGEDPS